MYKKLIVLLAFFIMNDAIASSIICPATVKAGTKLLITAKITNENCVTAMTINRTVVSLMGNSGAAGIGLRGPFVAPFANNFNTLIPHATCSKVPFTPGHPEFGTFTKVVPAIHTFANLVVIAQVPLGMSGTLAAVSGGVLDTSNKLTLAGLCHISVIK